MLRRIFEHELTNRVSGKAKTLYGPSVTPPRHVEISKMAVDGAEWSATCCISHLCCLYSFCLCDPMYVSHCHIFLQTKPLVCMPLNMHPWTLFCQIANDFLQYILVWILN